MSSATIARTAGRTLPRIVRPTTQRSSFTAQQLQSFARRQYSSQAPPSTSRNGVYLGGALASILALCGGYYLAQSKGSILPVHLKQGSAGQTPGVFKPTTEDYQKVYNAIATLLWEKDDYDDGSYGPVVLRLAWHASGTYDAESGTGGSNGATMRFAPESDYGAHNGLANARIFLEPIKEQFSWISYSDLWTLAGVCAVQEMQGPTIPWRPGRQDRDESYCSPDGRIPDATKEQNHLRAIFGRMGFNDQEIVALSGAHALGRCHQNRTGFEGPWTFSPTVLTNEYFRLLAEEHWHLKKWDGQKQWEDDTTKSLMMLPTDMALVQDEKFKEYVLKYAKDEQHFFRDFSDVVMKLFELGVPFENGSERLKFVTLDDQEEEE